MNITQALQERFNLSEEEARPVVKLMQDNHQEDVYEVHRFDTQFDALRWLYDSEPDEALSVFESRPNMTVADALGQFLGDDGQFLITEDKIYFTYQ